VLGVPAVPPLVDAPPAPDVAPPPASAIVPIETCGLQPAIAHHVTQRPRAFDHFMNALTFQIMNGSSAAR
jgi:hypothetical protein